MVRALESGYTRSGFTVCRGFINWYWEILRTFFGVQRYWRFHLHWNLTLISSYHWSLLRHFFISSCPVFIHAKIWVCCVVLKEQFRILQLNKASSWTWFWCVLNLLQGKQWIWVKDFNNKASSYWTKDNNYHNKWPVSGLLNKRAEVNQVWVS